MTPIHIDPEHPAMPISHPEVYAIYLAKKQGKFATLGLAEDTWALNNRVVDEKVFFEQAMCFHDERERMFLDAIAQSKRGLITTVFDTTDRVQHMFYRYLDPTHPRMPARTPRCGRTRSARCTSAPTRWSARCGTSPTTPTRRSW
jgi:hypothetical protein